MEREFESPAIHGTGTVRRGSRCAVQPFHPQVRPFLATQATLLSILGEFAATALLIGLVGVYGVGSHIVRARIKDIGIRLALGATAARVTGEVVGLGLRTALMGVPFGLALALTLGRAFEGLLFGVDVFDPTTLIMVPTLVLVLMAVALLAPARYAAAIDPARTTKDG